MTSLGESHEIPWGSTTGSLGESFFWPILAVVDGGGDCVVVWVIVSICGGGRIWMPLARLGGLFSGRGIFFWTILAVADG